MATRPFLVPPGPLSRETAAALTDLAGLFAAFYGRLSLGQGLEGVFGRDGLRLALNGQAFQGPFNFGNTTIVYQTDIISYVDTDITIDADSTVVEQGDWCWQHYYCHDVFTDTLSVTGTDNYAGSVKPWWRLSTGAGLDYYITGIVAPAGTCDGCEVVVTNLGPGTLHLQHQNTGSSAANRIITPTGLDWGLYVLQSARLRYDRTASRWRVLSAESVMTGATSLADGAAGLVPKPLIADRTLYLDGSGDWSAPAGLIEVKEADGAPDYTGVSVLVFDQADGFVVSQPGAGQARVDLSAFGGATSGAAGSRGAVPAPAAGDQAKFLRGDATWVAAGGAVEVKEQDGTPDYTGVSVLSVHQGAGLSLSQPGGAGTAQLTILSASATQAGVVDTSTQTFAGAKTFNGAVTLAGGVAATLSTSGGITEGGAGNLSGFGTVSCSTGYVCNGFSGLNTSFATGDGRTATFTGGILTGLA